MLHYGVKCTSKRIDNDWSEMLPYQRFVEFLDLMTNRHAERLEDIRNRLIHAISLSENIYDPKIGQEYLCLRTSQENRVTIKSFRRFHKQHFHCRVQDIGKGAHYVEYIPTAIILDYDRSEGISMEINLDLYEMLHRIRQGIYSEFERITGSYINLLIFKRQLSSTRYDEILLTEDEHVFYRVYKAEEQKLVMTDASQA